MKNEDKNLLQNAGIAAVDAIATAIDLSMGGAPLATGAWALSKALLKNGLELRSKKAIEWVEMIRDNPSIFSKTLLETEEFQDAFVCSLENYIKERNSKKRFILREIFKGYSTSDDRSDYPLEQFNDITNRITVAEAKAFSYAFKLSRERSAGRSFNSDCGVECTFRLIALGLFLQDITPRFASEKPGIEAPKVFISGIGAKYYEFIREVKY